MFRSLQLGTSLNLLIHLVVGEKIMDPENKRVEGLPAEGLEFCPLKWASYLVCQGFRALTAHF